MKRLKWVLRQTETQALLFCLFLFLVELPFVCTMSQFSFEMLLKYLFVIWFVAILFLLFIGMSLGCTGSGRRTDDERSNND